jgi:hypothetical protein
VLPADFDPLFGAGLGFLAFLAVFLGAGLTFCTGRFACFGALRAAPLFARRFTLRALGLGLFFRRSSTSRSFFSSFLRLFSSFVLFLSLALSRFFDATASSHPPERSRFGGSPAQNSDDSPGLRAPRKPFVHRAPCCVCDLARDDSSA